jgi:hypothetical protein
VKFLPLVFRNLMRRKIRTIFTVLSVLIAFVLFGALMAIRAESVLILRDLLPYVTGPEFTVKWCWRPGDVVVWDNRCTLHAATGFDHERYAREMWRLTLLDRPRAQAAE